MSEINFTFCKNHSRQGAKFKWQWFWTVFDCIAAQSAVLLSIVFIKCFKRIWLHKYWNNCFRYFKDNECYIWCVHYELVLEKLIFHEKVIIIIIFFFKWTCWSDTLDKDFGQCLTVWLLSQQYCLPWFCWSPVKTLFYDTILYIQWKYVTCIMFYPF